MAYRQLPGQASSPNREPERIAPIPEHYAGVNFPYRGIETHGVAPDPNIDYSDPETKYDPETDKETYLPEIVEHDPIPVRIVNESPRETDVFRVTRFLANGNAQQLIGRLDSRKSLRIKNLDDTNPVYIGPNSTVNAYTGYPISPGAEIVPVNATQEVWVTAGAGDAYTVEVAVLYEFTVTL